MLASLFSTLFTLSGFAAKARRDEDNAARDAGESIVQVVVIAVGVLALAGVVVAAIVTWANGQITVFG